MHFKKKGTDDLMFVAKNDFELYQPWWFEHNSMKLWNVLRCCIFLTFFSNIENTFSLFMITILFQLIRLCEWREYRWNLGNRIGFNTGVDTTKRISVCLLDLPNLVVKYYIEVPLILLLLLLQRCVAQGVSQYLTNYLLFSKHCQVWTRTNEITENKTTFSNV